MQNNSFQKKPPFNKILSLVAGVTLTFGIAAKKVDEISYEQVKEIKKGTTDSYITSRGEKFSVGQIIKLGAPSRDVLRSYDHIFQAPLGYPAAVVTSSSQGNEVRIKKISWKKGRVTVKTSKPSGLVYPMIITNFEEAIKSGEIESSLMSRTEAINELKEAKELLDLGVLAQSEYDEIKESLMPFLKPE